MINTPFIHLRTQSSYSLAESALKVEKLVQLAVKHHMPAIALTDNNNMFGTLEFSLECQKNGIQPIIGTSINILDIIELVNEILSGDTSGIEFYLSDLNNDAILNIQDLICLVNLILSIGD